MSVIQLMQRGIVLNPFNAHWSAQGNNLCLGHWEIYYQGQQLLLEESRREKDMDSYGIYSFIFPDDEDYVEGLPVDERLQANKNWLAGLFAQHDYRRMRHACDGFIRR